MLDTLMGTIENMEADEGVDFDDAFRLLLKAHNSDQEDLCPALLRVCCLILDEEEDDHGNPTTKYVEEPYEYWHKRACKLFQEAFPQWSRDDEEIHSGNGPFTTFNDLDWAGAADRWPEPVLRRLCNAVLARDIASRRYMITMSKKEVAHAQ